MWLLASFVKLILDLSVTSCVPHICSQLYYCTCLYNVMVVTVYLRTLYQFCFKPSRALKLTHCPFLFMNFDFSFFNVFTTIQEHHSGILSFFPTSENFLAVNVLSLNFLTLQLCFWLFLLFLYPLSCLCDCQFQFTQNYFLLNVNLKRELWHVDYWYCSFHN